VGVQHLNDGVCRLNRRLAVADVKPVPDGTGNSRGWMIYGSDPNTGEHRARRLQLRRLSDRSQPPAPSTRPQHEQWEQNIETFECIRYTAPVALYVHGGTSLAYRAFRTAHNARKEVTPVQTAAVAVKTVLVVDDGPDARDMMATLLRLEGYHARTAEGGAEALAAIEADRPDLVLLDLTMPDMDGFEVLRRLRADPRHDRLPVVMFSGIGDPRVADEARRLGAADFVLKGGGLDPVLTSIRRNLPIN
jgi:CheY-like chemotaxis protein